MQHNEGGEMRAVSQHCVKVLIIDAAIAFGGTLVVARNLVKHLDRNRVDVSLVSASTDGFVSNDFIDGAGVRLISPYADYVRLQNWKRAVRRRFGPGFARKLVEAAVIIGGILANIPYMVKVALLCRRSRADVVHLNNYVMEPLWVARLLRIPMIYHLHGYLPNPLDGSARRSFRHVKAFVSISRGVSDAAVRAGVDAALIQTIPNFVERPPESTPPALPHTPVVGIFGRVIPWKGQKQFLQAAVTLMPRFPELRLLVVGGVSDGEPGYMDECRQIAERSGYSSRIEFTGMVTDVTTYYRRCSVVVHASIQPEPFGMVLIEAMAEGRPVVASILGAAPEIIDEGVEGYIVDPNDLETLAARISDLLSDPGLALRMGLKGHSKVQALYDPRVAARAFERLYREVAGTA
jgi:glycosyltransferase involved in cell wall biosynthesis